MNRVENVGRRGFLKGIVGASAFVLSVRLLPGDLLAEAAAAGSVSPLEAGPFHPSVYLAIDTNGTVFIVAHRSEMGSGSRTALPLIVADELEAVWKLVKIVQATGDEKYGDQDTDGSHSVRSFFDPLREAGATARTMLVRAAAQKWGVPESQCKAHSHYVYDMKSGVKAFSGASASGRKAFYGELVEAAAKLEVPKKEELKLKPRSEWIYMGKGASSYDLPDMVTGGAGYGIDARAEGMLYANIAHPPVLGSTPKSVDDKAALAVKGVKQTVTLGTFKPPVLFQPLGGVAVVADSSWAAIQGKKKLRIEWSDSSHKVYTSDPYRKELQAASRKPGKVVRELGNVDAEFAKDGKVIEAEYYVPLLAHASMEPPAALAHVHDGKAEVWAATQSPQVMRDAVAAATGLKKEDVTVNVTLLGGAFGRKSFPDFAVEAAVLSKKTGKPVKVVWSREDDIQFDAYHSVAAMYLKAAVGADGRPTAWLQRSTFPPIASTFSADAMTADADEIGLGWSDLPFAVPNHRAENGAAQAHVRIGWLRSVGNIYHAFGIHSFADELAHAAGKDPLEYLMQLLGPDRVIPKEELPKGFTNYGGDLAQYPLDTARFRRVLTLAAERAGWGKQKIGNGFGMGIAVHRSFLTYVATVVQVKVNNAGHVEIQRVDTALDAGTVVNPEMARQQFEGGAVFGTSLALFGEITASNGAINQSNFHDYQVARMKDTPKQTNIYIVESDAPPAGIGEPGVPPFAPALCNAIFAATGKRFRELPLTKAGLA